MCIPVLIVYLAPGRTSDLIFTITVMVSCSQDNCFMFILSLMALPIILESGCWCTCLIVLVMVGPCYHCIHDPGHDFDEVCLALCKYNQSLSFVLLG